MELCTYTDRAADTFGIRIYKKSCESAEARIPIADTIAATTAEVVKAAEALLVKAHVPKPAPEKPELTAADRDRKVREMLLEGVDFGLIAGWIVDNAASSLDMKFMIARAMRGVQKLENL